MTGMTQQELVEQNVRILIGDLQLQLIIARARIAEMEGTEANAKANSADKEEPRRPEPPE